MVSPGEVPYSFVVSSDGRAPLSGVTNVEKLPLESSQTHLCSRMETHWLSSVALAGQVPSFSFHKNQSSWYCQIMKHSQICAAFYQNHCDFCQFLLPFFTPQRKHTFFPATCTVQLIKIKMVWFLVKRGKILIFKTLTFQQHFLVRFFYQRLNKHATPVFHVWKK